jgi:4-amino-4-deoxy-L-arabinose transferase-like glycosyltransferase
MTATEREKAIEGSTHHSFRRFLSAYRTPILIILLLAFAWRLVLVIGFPHAAFDEIRYTAPAVNMLAGRGFSSDESEPILPSEHTVPVYPLFIAAVYSVFGQHNSAVRVAQSAIDLITCLLVAFVSFSLAPPSLKRSAAMSGLIIYGCLSWFTVSWTRYILTETLATFLTMLAVAVSLMAFRVERWRWPVVGLICGAALLTRADAVLLVLAFGLSLSFQIVRHRSAKSVMSLLLFCSTIPVVLAPWIVRNYIAFGKFQPLASPTGRPHGEYVPTGYIRWLGTWMTDQTYYKAYEPFLHPGLGTFDPHDLPDNTFDSAEERTRIFQLFAQYGQEGKLTPEMSDSFRTIANERIKRAPMRFFVWLPSRRIAGMWLTGFATTNRFHRFVRILLVLPIVIGGIVGFVFLVWNSRLGGLLVMIILTRTVFFGFTNSSEHYIVEAYPPMIAACALTVAALWGHLNRLRASRTRAANSN